MNSVIDRGFLYAHVTGAGAEQIITASPCTLHTLSINGGNPTAGGTFIVYDGDVATGTIVAVVTVPKSTTLMPVTLTYDVRCATGLAVAAGGGLAGSDITISYR